MPDYNNRLTELIQTSGSGTSNDILSLENVIIGEKMQVSD